MGVLLLEFYCYHERTGHFPGHNGKLVSGTTRNSMNLLQIFPVIARSLAFHIFVIHLLVSFDVTIVTHHIISCECFATEE